MTTTCTDPAPLFTIDPSVNLAITMSPISRSDAGSYTWSTQNQDGDITYYCTNWEGDGILYWRGSWLSDHLWDQIMSPAEFKVGECSPATRRRRIVAFLTCEGFEVTTGRVVPRETHPAGFVSVMDF